MSSERPGNNAGSFLGTGWSFPPRFSAGGAEIDMVAGAEDIHQSLQILLATELGERVMQDEFGCGMNSVLFEEIDQGLVNSLSSLVSNAILYHEPRIKLERLDVSQSESDYGKLLLTIDYTIKSTNSRYNMVYPFYLNEAVTPGGV
ncbi:MAG: GPW/gp25 family protein [Proteobacteria bacterium]|nr:GPW/gp25 family protein [Pseudomonadota bacterium]